MWKIPKSVWKRKRGKAKKTRKRYQNFTEEGKEKSRQYYQERKKKLPEYRRNYYLTHKKYLLGLFKDPKAIRIALRINPWSVEEILKIFHRFKDFLL